jgi:hypothetical protein
VHKFQKCVSPLSIAKRQSTLSFSQKPLAAPQQYQLHRNMDVAAAALPVALNAALAGIGIGVLAAWLDAKLKSK